MFFYTILTIHNALFGSDLALCCYLKESGQSGNIGESTEALATRAQRLLDASSGKGRKKREVSK